MKISTRASMHIEEVNKRNLCLFAIASLVAVLACSDPVAPSQRISAESGGVLQMVVVNGPEDVPLEDGEEMPAQFLSPPQIDRTFIDVGFLPRVAWATAQMRYYATNARLSLYLKLKKNDLTIDRDSSQVSSETLFPLFTSLPARVNISTPAECGYRVDASASFTSWMTFPLPKTGNFFAWGHSSKGETAFEVQPTCPPVITNGTEWVDELLNEDGYTDDEASEYPDEEYDGTCQFCQFWYATVDDRIVAVWLDCTETDDSYCTDINAM